MAFNEVYIKDRLDLVLFGIIFISCFNKNFCQYSFYDDNLTDTVYFKSEDVLEKSEKRPIFEQVVLNAPISDGSTEILKRKGILTRYENAKATIILCHGFTSDKFDMGVLRHLFPKGMYNTLTFDFRAHGEDAHQQLCTFGKNEVHDVAAAVHFVKNHQLLKDKPIFAYGFSMGAVSAIESQARYQNFFDAMILDCPFGSSETVIKNGLSKMKVNLFGYEFKIPGISFLERYAFNRYVQSFIKYALRIMSHSDSKHINTEIYPLYPAESVKKITVPCFFIHCKHDDKIPTDDIRKMYENASGFKRLWITNGRKHYDSLFYNPERYRKRIRKFLKSVLDKSYIDQPSSLIWEDSHDELVTALVAPTA